MPWEEVAASCRRDSSAVGECRARCRAGGELRAPPALLAEPISLRADEAPAVAAAARHKAAETQRKCWAFEYLHAAC